MKIFIILLLLFIPNFICPKIKIYNLISDLKDSQNLYDENFNTIGIGKSGTNNIIIQLGSTRYINELKIYLDDIYSFDNIYVYTSENFITWNKVLQINNIKGKLVQIQFLDLATLFLKVIIVSKIKFNIQEIEIYDQPSPPNSIFDIKIENLSENSALIKWKTKNYSQDYFYFKKVINGEIQNIIEVGNKTNHSVQLNNLLPGSEYTFYIVSESPDGTKVKSDNFSFKTKGIPYPEIIELKALNITPFSAKLYYLANIPVSYEIFLGRFSNSLNKISEDKKLKENNTIEILGLQPESLYFYQLFLKDKKGNVVMTPIINFFTPPNNIALGKKVYGTFNNIDMEISNSGYGLSTVEKTVDGNLNYFGGMAISYNPDNSDQYVIIDLGDKEPINRIEVYWWGLGFSKNYRIDFSYNGIDWETIINNIDAEKGEQMRSPAGDLIIKQTLQINNKETRFVRLFVPMGSKRGTIEKKWDPWPFLYLCEISVIKTQ